jgi:sugar O-acyltransferase (sialic acid O-acetyltransferase NeuD family)
MYLYGASGHAKVIIDILKSNGISLNGIFDDNLEIRNLLEYKVLGKYNPLQVNEDKIIISIGNNRLRAAVAARISNCFGIAVHNSASVSECSSIDFGSVVMHKAIIQSDTRIGKHVIINSGAIVEHDCTIDNFVHISPNVTLCGNVSIGEGTHVGAGAIIIPGIIVGKWTIIGAGSVIIKHVPDFAVVVGNPGKIIKMVK